MPTARNLLFGALAFQNEYIDLSQFAAVCRAWAADKTRPLAELLVERGWINAKDRESLDGLVERKLKRYGGDAQVTLGAVADGAVRDAIRQVEDSEIQNSVSSLPPAEGHVLVSTSDLPPEQKSRYTLVRLHGQGGLGFVYLARDTHLNREVALKQLQPQQTKHPDACRRFLKEAQVTGQLEHPNIVPVYELGQPSDGEQPFYTMRFVRGRTLRDAISEYHEQRRAGTVDPLALPRLLNSLVGVCHAIGYAHSRGVIHRDLKPANVALGDFGEVIVLDWGLAKLVGKEDPEADSLSLASAAKEGATAAGHRLGTPSYMAPEQAEGKLDQIDARTDIYGVGAILFQILTGRVPHPGTNTAEVMSRIISGETPRARNVVRSLRERENASRSETHAVPPALDAICFKAMSKYRNGRYAKATDLADDVQRWLADEPVSCLREPLPIRARRWMKRHRTLVAASAAAVIMLVTSLACLLVLIANHNRTLIAKNRQLDQANTDLAKANQSERAAKDEADQKRIDAETARDETKRVLDYLVASFRSPDPSTNGEKLTVAELLDQVVEDMDTNLANQPLFQGRLLYAIGKTYLGLGLYQKAVAVLERARDLRRNELGKVHEDTLSSMNLLAVAYQDARRLSEALPLLEETLELRKAKLGTDHPDTLASMANLAAFYGSTGRIAEALQLYEQTLKKMEAELGSEHFDTVTSAMNNVAVVCESAGQLEDALMVHKKTLELRKAKLGPKHPDTLNSAGNLAKVYFASGRLADALSLFEETLELSKVKLGPNHPSTLRLMQNLASAYVSTNNLAEAVPLFEQALALTEARLGPEHSDTVLLMGQMASAYLMDEQPAKALPLYDRAVGSLRGRLPPDDPTFADVLAGASTEFLDHRQYPAAETYLRECLTIREKKSPDDWVVFNTKSMLGGALVGQKKFQEAEPLLVEGYSGMKEREAKIPPAAKTRLPEAIQRLIDLYTAWDRPEEAAKWQEVLEATKDEEKK